MNENRHPGLEAKAAKLRGKACAGAGGRCSLDDIDFAHGVTPSDWATFLACLARPLLVSAGSAEGQPRIDVPSACRFTDQKQLVCLDRPA